MSNLRPSDLSGVILSYISIDEFQPKTGTPEDIIVVTIYTKKEQAAADLKRFIETGMFNILDIESSDVPDERNRFLVFIELVRSKEFISTLLEILRDIENVSDELNWVFSSYMNHKVRKVTPKNLQAHIITNKSKYINVVKRKEKKMRREKKIKEIDSMIKTFTENSYVMNSKFRVAGDKKIATFYYSDPDYEGTFDYRLYGIKTRSQLKDELRGIKDRDSGLPSSVTKPLGILFGNNYRVYNKDDIIFIIPQFDLDMVLMLGTLE